MTTARGALRSRAPESRGGRDGDGAPASAHDAAAGDVITLAKGTYTGSFSISDSGTEANPS
jgi:hypothetical protein